MVVTCLNVVHEIPESNPALGSGVFIAHLLQYAALGMFAQCTPLLQSVGWLSVLVFCLPWNSKMSISFRLTNAKLRWWMRMIFKNILWWKLEFLKIICFFLCKIFLGCLQHSFAVTCIYSEIVLTPLCMWPTYFLISVSIAKNRRIGMQVCQLLMWCVVL